MEPGTLSDIVAVLIASLALLLTVWEARQTRKHNQLSLLPLLRFDTNIVPENERAEIRVLNKGTGFAFIHSYEMLIDGKTRQELSIGRWEELTRYLGLEDVVSYAFFDPTTVLSPGESHSLISIPIGTWTPDRTKQIRNAFRKLSYTIKYASPYEVIQVEKFCGRKLYGKSE